MATLTINTSGPEDARIAPAFGDYLGLPANANNAQVKADVIRYIVSVVRNYENKVATAAVTSIAPT